MYLVYLSLEAVSQNVTQASGRSGRWQPYTSVLLK
jgi:hypothetical protein